MRAEDLFIAIGGVESSRLERSELTVGRSSRKQFVEEKNMYQKKRLLPNILAAALIVAMLATTAFAAAGFILFDSPKQMIETLFGNKTGYDSADWSVPDYKGDVAAEYHSDRAPVDETAAEGLAPNAQPVGKSITWAGHTLTVDANVYDAATKTGFVTYTIENPEGIRPYNVDPTGEVSFPFGELLKTNQYDKSYIIREKTTADALCAVCYYKITNPNTTDLEMTLSFWADIADPEAYLKQPEKDPGKLADCPEKIVIPANIDAGAGAARFGGGAVILSPTAVQVDMTKLENAEFIRELKITFRDGSEYTVKDDTTLNCLFEVGDMEETTMMLNRLVDTAEAASVTVNGIVFGA